MKNNSKEILVALLKGDRTISDHQRESVLAILEGATPPLTPIMLKQGDVATLLSVSRQTVWALAKKGVLKAIRLDNDSNLVRYNRDQVLALANGHRGAA